MNTRKKFVIILILSLLSQHNAFGLNPLKFLKIASKTFKIAKATRKIGLSIVSDAQNNTKQYKKNKSTNYFYKITKKLEETVTSQALKGQKYKHNIEKLTHQAKTEASYLVLEKINKYQLRAAFTIVPALTIGTIFLTPDIGHELTPILKAVEAIGIPFVSYKILNRTNGYFLKKHKEVLQFTSTPQSDKTNKGAKKEHAKSDVTIQKILNKAQTNQPENPTS